MSGVKLERQRTDVIPEGQTLRPLRDYIVVKPLDAITSKTIQVVSSERKTVRGVAVAVGPGVYPWRYNSNRSKRWESAAFRKTQVKVGDTVNFGGLERQGYSFPWIVLSGIPHFLAREEDCTGIEGTE